MVESSVYRIPVARSVRRHPEYPVHAMQPYGRLHENPHRAVYCRRVHGVHTAQRPYFNLLHFYLS